MPSKPALVFVPGAWHAPTCFNPTTSILTTQHGYKTTLVALPSIGSELRNESPPQNWDLDVEAIRSAILAHLERGEDVVLIAHSYGGAPASEAAQGLEKSDDKPGIVRLLWVAAMAMPVGAWMWQKTGGKPARPERVIMEGDLSWTRDEDDWFYNECTEAQRVEAKTHVRSLAWKVFTNSKQNHQAWKDIPATYLMCENDHAIPVAGQEAMVDADVGCWTVERCDGDHSPFLSRVDFTVNVIRRAAGEHI